MFRKLRETACALGWHSWPGRHYEICASFCYHGIWYITAEQQCDRVWLYPGHTLRCEQKRTVRVLTHKELPK